MGEESPYTGEIGAYETLQAWGADKCVPLVREITFENAEELTEEGLPFLILFHHPDDKDVSAVEPTRGRGGNDYVCLSVTRY